MAVMCIGHVVVVVRQGFMGVQMRMPGGDTVFMRMDVMPVIMNMGMLMRNAVMGVQVIMRFGRQEQRACRHEGKCRQEKPAWIFAKQDERQQQSRKRGSAEQCAGASGSQPAHGVDKQNNTGAIAQAPQQHGAQNDAN